MKLGAFCHAFDRLYFTSFSLEPEHQARKNRTTIDQQCTRPALTQLAAVLRSGQVEIFTQHFEQSFMRCKSDFSLFAIKSESDMGFLFHSLVEIMPANRVLNKDEPTSSESF